jgi:hypothetical protein
MEFQQVCSLLHCPCACEPSPTEAFSSFALCTSREIFASFLAY